MLPVLELSYVVVQQGFPVGKKRPDAKPLNRDPSLSARSVESGLSIRQADQLILDQNP